MTTLDLMKRIRKILIEDRDAMWHGHVVMATGKVEDAAASEAIKEYDACLAEINIIIYAMETA